MSNQHGHNPGRKPGTGPLRPVGAEGAVRAPDSAGVRRVPVYPRLSAGQAQGLSRRAGDTPASVPPARRSGSSRHADARSPRPGWGAAPSGLRAAILPARSRTSRRVLLRATGAGLVVGVLCGLLLLPEPPAGVAAGEPLAADFTTEAVPAVPLAAGTGAGADRGAAAAPVADPAADPVAGTAPAVGTAAVGTAAVAAPAVSGPGAVSPGAGGPIGSPPSTAAAVAPPASAATGSPVSGTGAPEARGAGSASPGAGEPPPRRSRTAGTPVGARDEAAIASARRATTEEIIEERAPAAALSFQIEPRAARGAARIWVDGKPVRGQSARVLLDRGKRRVQIEARARGFRPFRQTIDLEGDRTVPIRFERPRAERVGPGSLLDL
jgi:hypothetical protein